MATAGPPVSGEHLPPPTENIGAVAWARQNLFSSPLNTALTLAVAYLLYVVIPPIISWGVIDATFLGDSKADCVGDGACWTLISVRFSQYVYGFYPQDQRWRIDLAFVVLILAMIPLFLPNFRHKFTLGGAILVLFPILGFILFYGGVLGLPVVETPLWGGLFLTLIIAGVGIIASLPIGIVLALGRRSEMAVVRSVCVVFIEVIRGVPLITILFMASVMLPLFLPQGVNFDKLVRCLVGVALFSSAYMAEVVRGGLQAIPKGQYEAAEAVGLGYWRMMGLIILPQALKMVIPGIVNTFIGLFKDTSLVVIIGLFDLLGIAQAALTDPNWLGLAAESYIFAAFGFWIFCFAMSRYSMRLERQLHTGHRN